MTTHLDDRSNPGDGAEAERPGIEAAAPDRPSGRASDEAVRPATGEAFDGHSWDEAPGAPLRTPMPTQSAISRLGDVLVSPFGRHRRETMVVLSLMVLALLVWVAVTELLVAPGASQSILS